MIVKQDYSLDKKNLSSRYMLISTTPRMVVCNNGIFQVALMPFYQTILSIEYGGLSKNVVYPKLSSPIKKHADHMGLQVFWQ